ncbi:unnamed protein product [Moneuplotes crassus]|uniref:Uncharacterized protein n=1 Tax=Euplotes crassus TaxID=5936 RepID=A0AAD1UP72_EUPCR|nr:unnamed protein product [Moneuplotes crassus]
MVNIPFSKCILALLLALFVIPSLCTQCTVDTSVLLPEEIITQNWGTAYTTSYFVDAVGTADVTYWIAKTDTVSGDIIRENADGTIPWVRRFTVGQHPYPHAHVLNNAGSILWLVDNHSSFPGVEVMKMNTTDGTTYYWQNGNDALKGWGSKPTAFISDDDSKVFFVCTDFGILNALVCAFDTSVTNFKCFVTGNAYPHGLLRVSDTRLIFFGVDKTTNHGTLSNVDPTPSTPTAHWQNQLSIPGGSAASMNKGAATTNTDKSKVYVALPIGASASTTMLTFMVLEESSGSLIGDIFASDEAVTDVDEVYYFFDNIYILAQASSGARLLVFNKSLSIFDSAGSIYRGIYSDAISGRLSLIGGKSNNAIVYKAFPEHLGLNGEFTTSSMTMSISTSSYGYSARTYSYSAQSTYSSTDQSGGHPNIASSTTATTLWQTSVNRFNEPVTIEVNPSFPFDKFVNATCSIGTSTPISYTFTNTDSESNTDWLTFHESNLSLSGTPPDSESDKVYKYNVVASWTTTPSGTSTTEIIVDSKHKEVTTAGDVAEATAQAQVGIAAGIAVFNAALTGAPPTSLWSLLNQLQMLLLLMLIDEYTPSDINEFLEGTSFVMLNFNFLPAGDIPGIDIPIDWFDFGEPGEKIQNLGIESFSTFVNNFSLVCAFILVTALHIVLKVIPWFKNKNHPNCVIRNIAIIRDKIIDIIFFGVYARLLLEAHETMVISSALEIREFDTSSASIFLSHLISWVFLLLCLIIPTFALYLFYTHRNQYDPEKKTPTMEFFEGLKNNKWARFYSFLLLFRRVLFVLIVIFMSRNVHRAYIYSILLVAQLAYFGTLIYLRPFEELQDNIIELVNELFLIGVICYLFAMTSGDKWTNSATSWFMIILTINCLIVLAIMIYFMIVNIIVKCREWRKSKESSSFSHLSVQEEHAPETENRDVRSKSRAENYAEEDP